MKRVLGLVLVGDVETETSIPPHEISLAGRTILSHARQLLARECDAVLEVHAGVGGSSMVDMVAEGVARLCSELGRGQVDGACVVVHDAFQPLSSEEQVREVVACLVNDKASVVAMVAPCSCVGTEGTFSMEIELITPLGFDGATLRDVLESGNQKLGNLSELVNAVSRNGANRMHVVPQKRPWGSLFRTMSLSDAEALVRVQLTEPSTAEVNSRNNLKRVLVFGASGGIGRACCDLLKTNRIEFFAPSRREVDLLKEADFPMLRDVDSVIHSAGAYGDSAEETMQVNFLSCVRLLSAMSEGRWKGSVVFLSSTAATFGRKGAAVYSASKAALNALIEAESEKFAATGIRINAVAPAKVATGLQEALNPGTPLDRMIKPEYVARQVLGLLQSAMSGKIMYIRKGEDLVWSIPARRV